MQFIWKINHIWDNKRTKIFKTNQPRRRNQLFTLITCLPQLTTRLIISSPWPQAWRRNAQLARIKSRIKNCPIHHRQRVIHYQWISCQIVPFSQCPRIIIITIIIIITLVRCYVVALVVRDRFWISMCIMYLIVRGISRVFSVVTVDRDSWTSALVERGNCFAAMILWGINRINI